MHKLFEKKISATGLGVFRAIYFLNFFFEVKYIYNNRQLFFDTVPFIKPFELDFTYPLIIWLSILIFIVIGYHTRFLVIINYLFSLIFISTLSSFEYHMDYVYCGMNFLAMFLPLSKEFSIDKLISQDNSSDHKVSVLYYYFPLFLCVGLLYFDSVLCKLTSKMWLNGLGVWLPASTPQITIFNDQWLLNQKYLMLFLGYLTLVFEFIFVFVFFIKKLRIPILIIGVGLHLGILLEFPIPYFALGMMSFYVLMVPVSLWDKLFLKISSWEVSTKLVFYIKKIFKSNVSYGVVPQKRKFMILKVLFISMLFFQVNTSFNAAFMQPLNKEVYKVLSMLNLDSRFNMVNKNIAAFSKVTLGITNHTVFLDGHFDGYNHVVGITYVKDGKEIWLPYVNENGMANKNATGSVWAFLGFRTNGTLVKPKKFEYGIARFTAFWARKNGISLNDATFKIKVKKIDSPNWKWEKDYLSKQLDKPWQDAGELIWLKEKAQINLIKAIEEI
ncbi:hypothetical protein [Pseudofulvibacter geojedonensis]|uniref:HTTM-like domain-containing protein n=1 Tax=Pseudofulvibacter geojedonensis TaxID=1123758 RepID=A0ABW3HYJ9_9FLAO